MTFSEETDEVQGVAGILEVYRNAMEHIEFSGPTLFDEVLQTATKGATAPFTQDTQHYSILMIITDGVVNDMKSTIKRYNHHVNDNVHAV